MKLKTMETDASFPHDGTDIHARYAVEAIRLLGESNLHGALHFLNLCLDSAKQDKNDKNGKDGCESPGDATTSENVATGISPADEVSLLEKRCLIHMKLSHFDEVSVQ